MCQRILVALEGGEGCASDLARRLDLSFNKVNYRLHQMAEHGLVEFVREEAAARGSKKRYYRRLERALLTDHDHEPLSERARRALHALVIEEALVELIPAGAGSGFSSRATSHSCRLPMMLEPNGWNEAAELLVETYYRLEDIAGRSANLIASDPAVEVIDARALMFLFEKRPSEKL